MKGPPPKNPATRQRRNKAVTADTLPPELPAPSRPGKGPKVPPLPRRKGKGNAWSAMSRAYWVDIWISPMAKKFLRADRHGLYLLIELVERYWRGPTASLAAEIRLQRACFGLTPVDRWRLQWGVSDDPPKGAEPPAPTLTPAKPAVPEPTPTAAAAGSDPRKVLTMVPKHA